MFVVGHCCIGHRGGSSSRKIVDNIARVLNGPWHEPRNLYRSRVAVEAKLNQNDNDNGDFISEHILS